MKEIYDEINKFEKIEIEEFKYKNYDEKFCLLILLVLGLLGFEFLFCYIFFRSFV